MIWKFIAGKMADSKDVVLLYVLESKGSSPGRQGFKMAIAEDGAFSGSIGGGIMEYKFVELAKAELAKRNNTKVVHRQVHDKSSANQSGMICSGEQTIFFYKLQDTDLPQIKALLHSISQNKNGSLHLNRTGILFRETVPDKDFTFDQLNEQEFILIEKTGFKNKLIIIGGGHCSLALSKIMHMMDFEITIYDDRPGLITMDQNEFAHSKIIVKDYSNLANTLKTGDNVYIVIMTFGYRSDDAALRAIYGKPFKYVGMMGSKAKIKKIFDSYKEEGIQLPDWTKIYSPIGVKIKSETPEEIAISIAAEIISVKNQ
jgi:xanthine dehydrogenase accessory factor